MLDTKALANDPRLARKTDTEYTVVKDAIQYSY